MTGCGYPDPVTAGYSLLRARDAFWRPSGAMELPNTNLAAQLDAEHLAARFWRLPPGSASTKHVHTREEELYVLLSGTGRMRIGDEVLTLETLDAVLVRPGVTRQVFNDTEAEALWLMVGAPPGRLEDVAYPEGKARLPPELGGGLLD